MSSQRANNDFYASALICCKADISNNAFFINSNDEDVKYIPPLFDNDYSDSCSVSEL